MSFEVWQAGDVTLYRGDCLEVLPTLADGCIDAVVTDPPYEMGIDRVPIMRSRQTFTKSRSIGLLWPVSTLWMVAVARLKPKHWVVWCGYRDLGTVHLALQTYGTIQTVFTWCKSNAPAMTRPVPRLDSEFIIWVRDKGGTCGRMGEFHSTILNVPNAYAGIGGGERVRQWENGPAAHPCQKPLGVTLPFIERLDVQSILDPFMGSGTTGVACVQTGRRFVGVELDPGYFEIARRRIEAAQQQLRLPVPLPVVTV